MNMQGKTVIITGGSSGIGKAAALEYVKRGANVVINGRREDTLVTAAQEIDPTGTQVAAVAGDISDPGVADRVVAVALTKFGRVDTLLNNAGIFLAKPFTEYTDEDFANVVSINMGGFFQITRRVAAEMLKTGSGHIVSITTSLVDQPIAGVPSILASLTKGGLNSATKSMAIEYADKGIRVNAVAPGIIKTPMHPEETHDFLNKLHPMGHMGEQSDIVDAILYLDSAKFVTGEILHVDGGQNAGR
ncbi:SDR family NAD(P)-dependent oxidoreductase [Paenibacillus sp. CF384]|uniref:SDR family NAD(P)-dependent oxidoreductase n=1 Tax=Paenibacillus sp. CF384 TaxID=1884382 RepID=UPI00089D2BF2|nr:SDR family NAD(P)-dependent oxidoreductase [Paenibacillus sp. CF384]SDX50048.1 NAD(P)-dependent dehydrogenase, short-chain alcohol dehydrogenase family [Paenibacillus sp. CF384]